VFDEAPIAARAKVTAQVWNAAEPSPIKWTVSALAFPLAYTNLAGQFSVTDILESEALGEVFREEVFMPNMIGNVAAPSGEEMACKGWPAKKCSLAATQSADDGGMSQDAFRLAYDKLSLSERVQALLRSSVNQGEKNAMFCPS
jgi:hypothetical protein